MKRLFLMASLAMAGFMGLQAETYTGNIDVTRNGSTVTRTATVTVEQGDNGLYNLTLAVPSVITVNMTDVPAATVNGITVLNAVRDVNTPFGAMATTLMARTVDGMMAADVSIPGYATTMWFNTVGDHFQLPNSDMEEWNDNVNEPLRWHSFMTADGAFAAASRNYAKLAKSDAVRSGSTGSYCAMMTAGQVPLIGTIANGTMTNGRLMAGSMTATSTLNHAEMNESSTATDNNGNLFYMPLYAKPDKFNVWLKYTQGTANADWRANVSVKTFDGTYYQEPADKTYTNVSGSIVGGTDVAPCDWTHFSFPFDYESYADNGAETRAIFVDFATNTTPGKGSKNDALYVDDIELVYLAEMTDLRYQGATINGWNPAVTAYSMEVAQEPDLNDFTAGVTGAGAVVTKTMEQNADGTWRIVVSAVSADLQTATAYVITATVKTAGKLGDVNEDGKVDVSDVTALIAYILGNEVTINLDYANVNGDSEGKIDVSDVTALIAMILGS